MSNLTSSIPANVSNHSANLNRNNKVAGYHCTLSHFITFKENKAHEIVGKSDSIASPIKCILPNEKPSLIVASCRKQVKNLLKSGCVPRQDHGIFTFCENFFEFVNQEWVLNCCDQAIQHLRFLIQEEKLDHPEALLCPITLSLFEEPVSDNHGHTFEKSAIEKQRQIKNECPINRESIISLVPNITVKGIIDDLQQKPLIPLLPSMVGKKVTEDNVKANRFLNMAKDFATDGDYKEALEMYEKAFACIDQYDDYEVIPDLFIKLNEPLKAALAYLYLVKKEIKNGQLSQILMTLNKLLRLVPHAKTILALQAFYVITQKDTAIAQEVFCTLALTLEEGFKQQFSLASGFPKPIHMDKEETTECKTSEEKASLEKGKEVEGQKPPVNKEESTECKISEEKASLEKGKEVEGKKVPTNNADPEKSSKADRMSGEALVYWEYALNCNPKNLALYNQISSFVDDNTKTRLFLLGFFHHYPQDSKIAREFYEKAIALQPKNPLIYLAILSRLEKKDPEKIRLYRALAEIFSENQKHKKAIYFFNKILSIETNPDDIQKYIDYLYINGHKEKAKQMTLSHIDVLCKENETNLLNVMQKFGRTRNFLELLFNIYVQKEDLTDLETLIPELASCYKNEVDQLTRIYQIAHEKLHLFDYSFTLAQILAGQNKKADSVRIFYDLYVQVCKEGDLSKAKLCEDELKKLNPVAYLSQSELQFLWTQTFPAQLSETLDNNHNETKLLLEQCSKSFNVLEKLSQQLAKNSEMLNEVQKSQSIALNKLEENVQEIKSTQQQQARSLQELKEELLNLSRMDQETKKSLQEQEKSLQSVSTKVSETYALQTKTNQQLTQLDQETKKNFQIHEKSLIDIQGHLQGVDTKMLELQYYDISLRKDKHFVLNGCD